MKQSGIKSLAELAVTAEPALLAYFRRRLSNPALAQEYTQETLLRFTEGHYDPASPEAQAVLFGIARHLLADHIRQQRREQAAGLYMHDSEIPLDAIASDAPTPDRIAQGQEELAAAMAIMQAMPKRPRQVLFMARIQGLKHREIAEKLGISTSMVEKHMMDATRRLLRGMKKYLR